jgi:lipid A 3-O-deacylase
MLVTCVLFFSASVKPATASEETSNSRKITASVEYLSPTEDDRNIESVNIDINTLVSEIDKLNLSIYAGIAITYATGDITQLEEDINQGTLREVKYKNSAFGAGPGILLSFRLIEINKLSFNLIGSGHFILYTERFPAGGDYYNFLWRGGPMFEYKLEKNRSIGFSYQSSHASNGQCLCPENPSYEGSGFALRYTGWF